jgi:phosphohistidine phosphatase
MQLLIIRHGVAVDRADFAKTGKADDLRPLTENGRHKFRRAAQGLRHVVAGPDVLATSPLMRAAQTARIVSDVYDVAAEVTDVLSPGARLDRFPRWLAEHAAAELVVVVGHDPHLSRLASWLITGVDGSAIVLKKGGACLLSFEATPAKGNARLEWLMTPSQLREIGE